MDTNFAVIETLESEVKTFADGQPYWAKYLAKKLLAGSPISEEDIGISYNYLLEELGISPLTERPTISINVASNAGGYSPTLKLKRLENVEGVNAIIENQAIDFGPNATVIFGANGSGKSGYVRLMKQVFYSRSRESIKGNVHLESGHKPVSAKFHFRVGESNLELQYPVNQNDIRFKQLAVFDGKSVLTHLDNRNEFEFRPAGLSFFNDFNDALRRVEQKLSFERQGRAGTNDFLLLFEGESEIKGAVQNLSPETDLTDFNRFLPFSEEDRAAKQVADLEHDRIFLASRGLEKEIRSLNEIKSQLLSSQRQIESLNLFFRSEYLSSIAKGIEYCLQLEQVAKAEGIESFKTEKILGVGSNEWKDFILATDRFAQQQKAGDVSYPESNDYCLLCQQPLTPEAQFLISKYRLFVKSAAEKEATQQIHQLNEVKKGFQQLNFDLFPKGHVLTIWLTENYPELIPEIEDQAQILAGLASLIILDIEKRLVIEREERIINPGFISPIIQKIDASILAMQGGGLMAELNDQVRLKTFYLHKEKLQSLFPKIELFVKNQKWLAKSNSINWTSMKTNSTNTEKRLTQKYFSPEYIRAFNSECAALNGNFGILVDSRGSDGRSNRQLLLKGHTPSHVLSEGEQKVIALAEFLTEIRTSGINKGIVFDDPVNSLDNERKRQIADRLMKEALDRQVIIFTHDLVFFYHLKNSSKKYLHGITNCFLHHTVEKESAVSFGRTILNSSPANEGQYNEPTIAEEWLARSKVAIGQDRIDFARMGLGSLRSSIEALAIFTILGGTVQRFDSQIRIGRLKDIKFNRTLIDLVIEKHGEISDMINAHLPSDEAGVIPSPEILESLIAEFKVLKEQIKAC